MCFNFLNVGLLSKRCHLIMNVNYDYKSVLKLSFSRKKMLNLFLKKFFRSHFLHFSILLQIIHTNYSCQISINFRCFLIQGSFIKMRKCTMYSYFSTSTFVKLVLLISFYFLCTLLHYPIFLLTLDEFIANNKQTWVICITSK